MALDGGVPQCSGGSGCGFLLVPDAVWLQLREAERFHVWKAGAAHFLQTQKDVAAWQVRHSQELADNSARLCGCLAGPSEANPVTLCQATVGYREKSSTLALHEIEDVNAKKEGQKQVR